MSLLSILCYLIFILSAIVLIVVILLQEGKGGGFGGESLGGHGQQTFGVAAGGIQKFTGVTALVFLASAVTIHIINKADVSSSVIGDTGGVVLSVPGDDPGN
jgi:preprotein translocase subunit SecG